MTTKKCNSDHESGEIPVEVYSTLPSSQAGRHRHLCAACAYLLGRKHAEQEALRKHIRAMSAELEAMNVDDACVGHDSDD
jgi:hypothetical protein